MGLRFVDVRNIIVQNIKITNLNQEYVWSGDALSLSGTSDIWIDHVTTSSLGRRYYRFGSDSSSGIAISNSFINGQRGNSATCDGHTYWGLEFVGSADQITFYSMPAPQSLVRDPLFHAVNVFAFNNGHLIEGGTTTGIGLYEGNHFEDVPIVLDSSYNGLMFASESADPSEYAAYLGRDCVENNLSNCGHFTGTDTSFVSKFEG
ncbi:putative Pectin lyase E [Seiridium unicorne]|uniref:Pectin lyase E n=1 Tax=Seiridium unicorne TaxID=138068 RepID=A0ABR2UGL5_9PEZI